MLIDGKIIHYKSKLISKLKEQKLDLIMKINVEYLDASIS